MPPKGYKHIEDTKKKISESHKGKHHSEETKQKIREKLMGNKNKLGKKNNFKNPRARAEKISKSLKGHPIYKSPERSRNISNALKGKPSNFKGKKLSPEAIDKIRVAHLGKKLSVEHKIKLREINLKKGIRPPVLKGTDNPAWKGGVTPLYEKIRHSFMYDLWRKKVFEKDNYICQNCSRWGGNLEVHHLKSFFEIITEYNIKDIEGAYKCKALWDINNGITFCQNCHAKIDSQRKI